MFLPFFRSSQTHVFFLQILGLATVYFITGKLGIFLAIPPGYATAIWPASGIALACVLVCGYRVWPGVLIGSFLVNISTSLTGGSTGEIIQSCLVTLAIGIGASLQAMAGAFLIRRFAGYPNALTQEKDIILFLFLGGFVAALVNSTIGSSILTISGRVSIDNFWTNWAMWWMGDVLGVIIFAPLLLVWLQPKDEQWSSRRVAISLPITVAFLITTAAVYFESEENSHRLKKDLEQQSKIYSLALMESVTLHLNILQSLGSFYAATPHISRSAFQSFTHHPLANHQGLKALSYNPRISDADRAVFEQGLRQEAVGLQITELDQNNQLVPASRRTEYVPVQFIEPQAENKKAVGYDVYSNPIRHVAIDRAIETGEMTATAPITLVQEPTDQKGILVFLPIRSIQPTLDASQKQTVISGFTVALFRGNEIVNAALNKFDCKGLVFRLLDETNPYDNQLIFSSDSGIDRPFVLKENGLFGRNISLINRTTYGVAGRQWTFEVFPTQEYLLIHQSDDVWFILLGGLLFTSLVGVFVLISSGREILLLQMVSDRTRALTESEQQFRMIFEFAPVGVVRVATNGKFLDVNKSYCDFVGYSREELLAMNVQQVSHPDFYESEVSAVNQLLTGKTEQFNLEKKYIRKDGQITWGNLSEELIRNVNGDPDFLVAVIVPIDQRKQIEVQIEQSLALLSTTLDSTNDAILVVDLNQNIVLYNQRFIDLWHIPNHILAARDDEATLAFVLDQLENPREFLDKVHHIYALPESKSLDNLLFKNQMIIERYSQPHTMNGQIVGRVWTFRDITEQKAAEAAIKLESEKNALLLRNASDGIHILDMNARVIECSDSFCAMLGYRRDEVIGMHVTQWDAKFSEEECCLVIQQQFENPTRSLFETQHRSKNGTIIDVEVSGFPLQLNGQPVLFNSSRDISERKRVENLLHILSLAVEQSPNLILITDTTGNIEYVNSAFTLVTGYESEEVLGKNPRLLQSGKTPKSTHQSMWSTLLEGRAWKGELINRTKQGAEYIESAWIAPIQQSDKKITHFLGIKEDITERRRAELTLQESEQRFRTVADAAPVLIWMAGANKLCYWFNQVWLDFTGLALEQLTGLGWTNLLHPEDRQQCMSVYDEYFDLHQAFRVEYRIKRYDGEYRWMHDNGVPRFDQNGTFMGFIGSCIDITDRKSAEQELAAQNQRYETLLKSSTDAIYIIDVNGDVVDINDAFCQQLDYPYQEAIRLNICQWVNDWSTEEILGILLDLIHSNQPKRFEIKHRRKDGSLVDVEVNAVHVNIEGRSLLFNTSRDITERKQNEAVILLAKERAEMLAHSQSEFIANMSHEIRTPMNAIIGLSQLALNKALTADIRDYLEKISSASNNLLNILNDILDFSKLEAGHLTINEGVFNLDSVVVNIKNLFTDKISEKQLQFVIVIADNVPRQLVGDALRLQQILINLLGNAIKFTDQGSVRLEIRLQQLKDKLARLVFSVTDTGIGISAKDLTKLFQPFSQVDGSITRRFGGTGLGLTISQNLLHRMGSAFSVDSHPGQGSCFSFELDLGISLVPELPLSQATSLKEPELQFFGVTVLVVEDNAINQQVVKEFLKLSGIDVTLVSHGREAIEMLEQSSYDAILMDVQMPEMDGFEATRIIRSKEGYQNLPIIALSAGVTLQEQEQCVAAGMNDFIAKPIVPQQLLTTLSRWLRPEQSSAVNSHTQLLPNSVTATLSAENRLILLQQNLKYLDQLLSDHEFISDTVMDTLVPFLNQEQQERFTRMRRLISELHYDQARVILQLLLA